MIPKSGNRFSEKHALGLDPRDHAQTKNQTRLGFKRIESWFGGRITE
jgi:hypothetical protein